MDVGKKRIGVAVSDALGITAQPMEMLLRKNKKDDIRRIRAIASDVKAEKIIVGLPLNMDGTAGPAAREVYDFAECLRKGADIPIEPWDERFTTKEAERILLRADLSRKKRKMANDNMAAQLILQSYLDSRVK